MDYVSRKPIDVVEYELARDIAEEAWDLLNQMAGCDKDILEEKLSECQRLQARAQKLHEQLNCEHETDPIGRDWFYAGEWHLDEREVCVKCGEVNDKCWR